ncbi:pyridoxal phosphate-dependent aminotransferase [Rudanella lutea]|uniref:pyridoxal phosphate-dependent aminotransferase n=1 Tax=Rudanella lutea TaxID=451374 RepID=UPI0003A4DF07|nr:histidinol-phosphate transaminase [Rudanella lutea]
MTKLSSISRRDWLRASGLLAAGLTSFGRPPLSMAAPLAGSQQAFAREFYLTAPPETMPKLKARLMANENPYGISPKAREALVKAVDLSNRYAWMEFGELANRIGEQEGVARKNILFSPGSSDILMAAAAYYTQNGDPSKPGTILTCRPTYDDLLERSEAFGANIEAVPLTPQYEYDLDAMKARIGPNTKMVYIVNPNNPTGTIVNPQKLEAFVREVAPKVPVFLDEAYIDFLAPAERPNTGKLVAEGLNVIVARTFSKIHAFAGLRLGYGLAQPEVLKALRQYTNNNFGVSITTLMAGIAAYEDREWQTYCRTENAKVRDYTTKALKGMGYEVIPSYANFLLFPIRMKPKTFENQMWANGIGIQTREFGGQPWCRVSIGTQAEMEAFLAEFKKVVG